MILKSRFQATLACVMVLLPIASIAQQLWGTTSAGGANNIGLVFSTGPDASSLATLKSFTYTTTVKGVSPQNATLLKATSGLFYGMSQGGTANYGQLFEYNLSAGTHTRIHDFTGKPNDGSSPTGSVVQAGNGKLYGMTNGGGGFDQGILFEYDPVTKIYSKKIDFDCTTGCAPQGSLILGSNGKLYGFTSSGGTGGSGTAFEFDPATGSISKRASFDSNTTGAVPFGDFVQTADGKLYGSAAFGGVNGDGTIVLFDPVAGTLTVKANLTNTSGFYAYGGFTMALNGKLYGLNSQGGSGQVGELIEFDPATSTVTSKVDFLSTYSYPNGALSLVTATGKLYGFTTRGGASDCGVIFEYNPTGNTFTKKIDLNSNLGCSPNYGAMTYSGGKFYGMTSGGGANNTGVIFEYDPATNALVKKFDFGSAADGKFPPGELTIGADNKVYGVTEQGGVSDGGIIYQIDPATTSFTKKTNFTAATGVTPIGRMISVGNKLYGAAYNGGNSNSGTIYSYDLSTATITKKFDFDFNTSGSNPTAGLSQAPNGKLYGVTIAGGPNFGGSLFEFDPNTEITTVKFLFDNSTIRSPQGALTLAPNNKFYGVGQGGANNRGGIFEYDPAAGTYATKVSFSNTAPSPASPRAALALASNGKLYGVCTQGGANGTGCIFEYDPGTTAAVTKYSFPASGPITILGGLVLSSNNKLYGTTNNGGANGYGSIFEFDPATSIFTTRVNFNVDNGSIPWRGSLTLIPSSLVTGDISNIPISRILVSPNPAHEKILLTMKDIYGEKTISIVNLTGQEVASISTSDSELVINVAGQSPGMYFVKVLTTGASFIEKYIKR